MPALVKVSPDHLRQILIEEGWRVHAQDPLNWSMVKGELQLQIPKRGRMVSFEVMENALLVAEIPPGRYLELRERIINPPPLSAQIN
jgi:hypothetical protein